VEARWRRGLAPPDGVQCARRSERPHPDYEHGHRRTDGDDDDGGDDDDDLAD
jgi:hypothetical protein